MVGRKALAVGIDPDLMSAKDIFLDHRSGIGRRPVIRRNTSQLSKEKCYGKEKYLLLTQHTLLGT